MLPAEKQRVFFNHRIITKAKEILELPIFEGGDAFPKNHDIALKGVCFSYDGKTNVLENCSLCIRDGEKIAVVGASGAGKSTVAALIARFYDVDGGEIMIGGKNIKSIQIDCRFAGYRKYYSNRRYF